MYYAGFTVKHYHEHLVRDHGFRLGYTWLKTALQARGAVKKAPRRSVHRKKRPRRPLPGMLLFQDGSTHRWLPGLDWEFDLIATLDDATGEIYSAFLVDEEGTISSFRGLSETIRGQGLFCSFYTDRGSHYFHTPKAGGKVDKARPTQVGRALAQLGIEHIPSYSPQARGRMERLFGTLQKRWPQELGLRGIRDPAAANRYLQEVLIPDHNARFAVAAEQPGSAFVPYAGTVIEDILCLHEPRVVDNDNTVQYNRLTLQIPESPLRRHDVKAAVKVHEYSDRRLAIFHGPRCIARYDQEGNLIDDLTWKTAA